MAGADLTVGRALLAVRRAVREALLDLPSSDLVLVACSGGADSLALAAGAAISGHRVGAVVIDHGLQAGSEAVAQVAAQQCRDLGLAPVVVRTVQVGTRGGMEAAAREARYAALREVAAHTGARALLLAHTLDDQAETVLLRLARGSGARSLSAMAPVTGDLRRPLLELRRDVVRRACAEAGLAPHEDPHNTETTFARVRVRLNGLPALQADLGDDVVLGLARSAAMLREDNQALDEWAGRVVFDADPVAIDVDQLDLPRAVRLRVLRRMALAAGCPAGALTREHLISTAALVENWKGQGPIDLPGGVRATRKSDRLVLHRGPGRNSAR
ncbi:MAG: tRNA lysidine(34) synthetase TilS [Candidatus Nanopelagicales bacterium]|nr:tRNA lysidine(34) synthetase TilS [Candidatus Nanopelagicales bacterium]